MSWVKLLILLLQVSNKIASTVRASRLMDAGAAEVIAKNLAEISSRLEISQKVAEEVSKLTDEDLNAELRNG